MGRTLSGPEPTSRFRFTVLPEPDLQVWYRFGLEAAEPKLDRTSATLLVKQKGARFFVRRWMPWVACSVFALGFDFVVLAAVRRKEGGQLAAHEVVVLLGSRRQGVVAGCAAGGDSCRLFDSIDSCTTVACWPDSAGKRSNVEPSQRGGDEDGDRLPGCPAGVGRYKR